MDMHQDSQIAKNDCMKGECHCSVCFKMINDIEAARHSLAGRYYCKSCRATFRKESLGRSDSKAV